MTNDIDKLTQNITWLGHDGFLIEAANGKKIAIDPFQLNHEFQEKVDLILITHSHYDHCSPGDISKLRSDNTVIITEAESAKKLSGNIRVVRPNESISISDIHVKTVAAYNTDKEFHPKEARGLGYIITVDDMRIYHAGDTDLIDEMSSISADIALLPVSGTYVMTAQEAVEATKLIQPIIAIPMHFGSIIGDERDAEIFRSSLEGICKVIVPTKGNRLN